jgi:3-methyladenine DNA glycosylase AlkD
MILGSRTGPIITKLRSLGNKNNLAMMKRFGIDTGDAYGITMPEIRKIACEIGKDSGLAVKLWDTGIHEARSLAGLICESEKVTEKLMEEWVKDFNSWDTCDIVCTDLFDRTKFAYKKAVEWTKRKEEFVKRAGFVLMAGLAVHDKKAKDGEFIKLFKYIKKEATDERNFVKKAVNWALRNIGKRNINLNKKAIKLAEEIKQIDSRSAKWIAADAIRELKLKALKLKRS